MSLLDLTVATLCFDINKEESFEEKRQDLLQAHLSLFKKLSEALAHILQLLQAANTAYGGDFMTTYDLFKLVKAKLREEIQYEMDEITALDKSFDLRRLDWGQLEDLVTDAWATFSRRPKSYYAHCEFEDMPPPLKISPDTNEFTAHPSNLLTNADVKDQTLKCQRYDDEGSVCGQEFMWSAREQLLHKRLGYTSIPKSCPKHKPTRAYANNPCRKTTAGAPDECDWNELEKCKLYQAGKCHYGSGLLGTVGESSLLVTRQAGFYFLVLIC
jgi:hypothetical protein